MSGSVTVLVRWQGQAAAGAGVLQGRHSLVCAAVGLPLCTVQHRGVQLPGIKRRRQVPCRVVCIMPLDIGLYGFSCCYVSRPAAKTGLPVASASARFLCVTPELLGTCIPVLLRQELCLCGELLQVLCHSLLVPPQL